LNHIHSFMVPLITNYSINLKKAKMKFVMIRITENNDTSLAN